MDKQYSVKFFTSLVESMQKVCRDYLDFEQAVDLSGYLCVEIDNFKKERYVLSELIQNTGDVISESYCTKAFKTLRKPPRESSGLENNDPKQTLMTSVESSHAVGSGLNRMSSRRSDSSSSRVGHNTSHIDSKWNISPRSPYSSSSAAARKRNIPQSSVSSLKRDRGDSYRGAVESEPYSSVIPTNTNAYLTESVSESATQTLSVPSISAGSSFSMTLPSASMPHSSATQSVSNTGETIRLPLNVTVKEEDDISFMVLDDTEDFDNSVTYGDNDTSNSFVHTQTNEKLMSASPNAGDQENAHTARKMKGHVKLFQDFLYSKHEMRPMLEIPPYDLDPLLGLFFVSLRKENGEDYEPSYLRNISSILGRYFRLNNYSHCLKSEVFSRSREMLQTKVNDLLQGKEVLRHREKIVQNVYASI